MKFHNITQTTPVIGNIQDITAKNQHQNDTYNNETNSTAPQKSSGIAPSRKSDQSLASTRLPKFTEQTQTIMQSFVRYKVTKNVKLRSTYQNKNKN